jgi:hypothetical protein
MTKLIQLTKQYPNDTDLGKEVRKYINEINSNERLKLSMLILDLNSNDTIYKILLSRLKTIELDQ